MRELHTGRRFGCGRAHTCWQPWRSSYICAGAGQLQLAQPGGGAWGWSLERSSYIASNTHTAHFTRTLLRVAGTPPVAETERQMQTACTAKSGAAGPACVTCSLAWRLACSRSIKSMPLSQGVRHASTQCHTTAAGARHSWPRPVVLQPQHELNKHAVDIQTS